MIPYLVSFDTFEHLHHSTLTKDTENTALIVDSSKLLLGGHCWLFHLLSSGTWVTWWTLEQDT